MASSPVSARKSQLDGLAVGLLLACCLFWGFQQVLVKATLPLMPAVFQAALRFAGATLLLWLWCLARGVPLFARDDSLKAGLLVGALFAAEFACIYIGLQYTSASRLTILLYTSPFWVAVLLPLFVSHERLGTVQWLGLALAFGAVVFAMSDRLTGASADTHWSGDLLGLLGGLFWGLTTVAIRGSNLTRVAPEKLLFYQVAVSALTLPWLSLALGEPWVWQFGFFASMSLVLQTVIGAFASYLAWMWMLGRYPTNRLSVFVFLTPVFALLFGAMWLDEAVTLQLLAALGLVALGIVLVNR